MRNATADWLNYKKQMRKQFPHPTKRKDIKFPRTFHLRIPRRNSKKRKYILELREKIIEIPVVAMLLLLSTTIVETVKVFGFVRNPSAQSRILFIYFFFSLFFLWIFAPMAILLTCGGASLLIWGPRGAMRTHQVLILNFIFLIYFWVNYSFNLHFIRI